MPRMSYRPEEIIAKLRQAAIQILPLSGATRAKASLVDAGWGRG